MTFASKADEVVTYMSLAVNGVALGNAAYRAEKDSLSVKGEAAYAAGVAASVASMSTSALAAQVLTNLGVTAATIGQASYDALLPAFITQLDLYGVGSRGQVILNVTRLLSPLTSDATYGAAARTWNSVSDNAEAFSVDPASTGTRTVAALTPPPPPVNTALTLTAAADTIAGGAGNDTIAGATDGLTSTLNAGDQIDGGAGSDTANLTIGVTFGGFTVGTGFLKNVETVNLTTSGTVKKDFTAKAVTGVNTYNITGNIQPNSLDSAATVLNFKSFNNSDLTIGHNAEAVVGAGDTLKIGLDAVATTAGGAVTVTTAGIESIDATVTGANIVNFLAGAITSIKASGTGSLTTSLPTSGAITSFDASGVAGTVALTTTGITGNALASIKTGAGNDTLTVDPATDVAPNATIDAGAGTNTLNLVTGAAGTTSVQFVSSGISTVGLASSLTGTLNYSASKSTTPITAITVAGSVDATANFSNVGAGDIRVTVSADGTTPANATVSSDNSGAATVALTVGATTNTTPSVTGDSFTFSKASALTVTVPQYGSATGTFNANKASTVTLDVGGRLNGAVVNANEAKTLIVKHTDKDTTSAFTFAQTTAAITDLQVTNAGTINMTNAAVSTVRTATVDTTNAFSFTTAMGAANKVTVTGVGTSAATTLGALGTPASTGVAGNAYGLEVTATGQHAGFTTGALGTGPDQTITVDVTGVTGTRSIGNATVGTSGTPTTGLVTVKAAGSGTNSSTTLSIGNLSAKNTVVDLKNSIGAATIGTLAGSGSGSTAEVNATGLVGTAGSTAVSVGQMSARVNTVTVENVTGNVTLNSSGAAINAGTTSSSAIIKAAGLKGALTTGTVSANTIDIDVSGSTGNTTLGTLTGNSVTVKGTTSAGSIAASSGNLAITANTSVSFSGPEVKANAVNITAGTSSTALTVTLNGGFLADTHTITSSRTGQTSIVVRGDLGTFTSAADDSLVVSSMDSTAVGGQTIDLSGLTVAAGTDVTIRGSLYVSNTITGTAGDDTIFGGSAADTIFLGTGSDEYRLNNPTDTGTISGITLATTVLTAGASVSTATFDVVNGFGTGDKLAVGVDVGALTAYGFTGGFGAAGRGGFVTGTYSASAKTFTYGAGGLDSLFVFDQDGAGAGTSLGAIVLVGYVAAPSGNGTTGLTGTGG